MKYRRVFWVVIALLVLYYSPVLILDAIILSTRLLRDPTELMKPFIQTVTTSAANFDTVLKMITMLFTAGGFAFLRRSKNQQLAHSYSLAVGIIVVVATFLLVGTGYVIGLTRPDLVDLYSEESVAALAKWADQRLSETLVLLMALLGVGAQEVLP